MERGIMDIGKALGFVFEDEEWLTKLLLAAAISVVPFFGGVAVTGYTIAVLRNVRAGEPRPLPGWDGLGSYFVDGLMYWIATLVYSIPFLILACPIAAVWILPAVGGENQDLAGALAAVAGIATAGLGCLMLLYGALLWLLTPVLQIRYAERGSLASCLQFGDVFRLLFDNIGTILVAQVLMLVAYTVVTGDLGSVIGTLSLIPICGWIVSAVLGLALPPIVAWLMLVGSHLYGQIAQSSDPGSPVV